MVVVSSERQLLNAQGLSQLLGISVQAVRSYTSRKNWDHVPPPGRFGNLNKWSVRQYDEWLAEKETAAKQEAARQAELLDALKPKRGRGRPRKSKEVA